MSDDITTRLIRARSNDREVVEELGRLREIILGVAYTIATGTISERATIDEGEMLPSAVHNAMARLAVQARDAEAERDRLAAALAEAVHSGSVTVEPARWVLEREELTAERDRLREHRDRVVETLETMKAWVPADRDLLAESARLRRVVDAVRAYIPLVEATDTVVDRQERLAAHLEVLRRIRQLDGSPGTDRAAPEGGPAEPEVSPRQPTTAEEWAEWGRWDGDETSAEETESVGALIKREGEEGRRVLLGEMAADREVTFTERVVAFKEHLPPGDDAAKILAAKGEGYRYQPPICHACGRAHDLVRRFNSGNPMIHYEALCGCDDESEGGGDDRP